MRTLGVLSLVVCGSVLLAGCGGTESASTSADQTVSFEGGAPAPAATPGIRVQKAPSQERAPSPAPDVPEDTVRKEVVTGTVDLTAEDPVAVAQTLAGRVLALDGRIDQRTENPGTDDAEPHANLIIRIPATETDAFIDGLGDLAEVTEISTSREDVTLQWQDLDARITALRASVDRLRDLMARAANTADLIAAEEALADRQAELDSLTGQRRYLDDQIALSTLVIDIGTVAEKSGDPGPSNFWDGVLDGWNSLLDWLKGAVVFAGQAVPWLVFVAVIGGIAKVFAGLIRRRSRQDDTAGRPAEPRSETASGKPPVSAAATEQADKTAGVSDASSAGTPDSPGKGKPEAGRTNTGPGDLPGE
ncbi:DUF4349 domain-containing protein [Nocardia sp. X0981]